MRAKDVAARLAVGYIRDGMMLGIGTGSTAAYAIQALGERIRNEGLKVHAVPTSVQSRAMAEVLGIPLVDLSDPGIGALDLTIDGADEVDPALNLIKGGGGALLREKIVARASHEMIVICDSTKCKQRLGAHPLPVAVVPFGFEATHRRLSELAPTTSLRRNADGSPFLTDDGLYIYDLHCGAISDPAGLERQLKQIVGVVEVGLFIDIAARVIVGYPDGHTEVRTKATGPA